MLLLQGAGWRLENEVYTENEVFPFRQHNKILAPLNVIIPAQAGHVPRFPRRPRCCLAAREFLGGSTTPTCLSRDGSCSERLLWLAG